MTVLCHHVSPRLHHNRAARNARDLLRCHLCHLCHHNLYINRERYIERREGRARDLIKGKPVVTRGDMVTTGPALTESRLVNPESKP